jgi:hypothetical protein
MQFPALKRAHFGSNTAQGPDSNKSVRGGTPEGPIGHQKCVNLSHMRLPGVHDLPCGRRLVRGARRQGGGAGLLKDQC